MPLLRTSLPLLLALLCSLLLALLCSLLLSLLAANSSSIGSLPKLCCSLLGFSPHVRGTCLWQGRKTKDNSRSVTCAAVCLGYLSMCRLFWSHAKSSALLGGTLGEMRPGAAVMAHPRRWMAVGCHWQRAQHGTSCSAVTGASSAALRGGECLAPSHFFHEPSHYPPPPCPRAQLCMY